MNAVIKISGKQYNVSEGSIIEIEKIKPENEENIEINEILYLNDGKETQFGNPTVEGAKVIAEYLGDKRAKKILMFKHKRRKHHIKRQGHRQTLSKIKIKSISF